MKHELGSTHRFRSLILGGAVLIAPLVTFVAPASAYHGVPKPTPKTFAQCPVDALVAPHAPVSVCIVGVTNQGTLDIGGLQSTFRGPGVLQGGYDGNGGPEFNFAAALDGQSFSAPRQLLSKPVLALLGYPSGVKPPANSDVYAVAQQAGPIEFALTPGGNINPTTVLPLSFHLLNPLLGPNCYVGTVDDPITLTLQTGTSGALAGNLGQLVIGHGGKTIQTIGTEVVDGQFSVPGATGCGVGGVWDSAIDGTNGLPSASGANEAILYGNFDLATAKWVRNNLHQ